MEEMKRSSYPFYNIEICDKVFYSGRNKLYRVTNVIKNELLAICDYSGKSVKITKDFYNKNISDFTVYK